MIHMALLASTLRKQQCLFFFFFSFGLDAQRPGPSVPGSSAVLPFNTIHQRDGLGRCARERTRPSAAAAELGEKPLQLPSLPAAVCASLPQQLVCGQVPADAPWAELRSRPGGGSHGVTPGELGSPSPRREEHRRGHGCSRPRHGGSQRRKMGIFRWAERERLGHSSVISPASPEAPRSSETSLEEIKPNLGRSQALGLLPVPGRKPGSGGAVFLYFWFC